MTEDVDVGRRVQPFVDALLRATTAHDPAGLREELDRATGALGLGECIDGVLLPALREVGRRWQLGSITVATERLTTEAVRGWLEVLSVGAPEPQAAAPLLLACGPGERHSVGLESLAVLLRYQGRPCRVLGARASARALRVAVTVSDPSAVVVVAHLNATRLRAVQAMAAVADLGPELFYAGGAFADAAERAELPGTYLGTNMQNACVVLAASVDRHR